MQQVLIDAGPIVAYYDSGDDWHKAITKFLSAFKGRFITTAPVVTEALWLLNANVEVQNELLRDLAKKLYAIENLQSVDFIRIAELNSKYSDVPADFADLSLIAIAERLEISEIVTLDSDFDVYRHLRSKPFKRLFPG
jgi:predicted nucleic acid-binding protein